MSRKALSIFVDVDIQAVTCPGVWLCPNGKVRLVLSMLGQQVRSRRIPPVFPLLIHEHFSFHKVFPSAGCLSELQSLLGIHDVEAVLLQEADGEAAVQLARFSCSVLHLLFPSPCSKGLLAGVDVDLLMEASADFPGILAPKIELSTRTTVEEITDYYASAEDYSEAYVINPKTLVSRVRHNGSPVYNAAEANNRDFKGSLSKKHRSRRASCVQDSRQRYNTKRRATSLPRRIGSPRDDGEIDSVDPCNMTCSCVTGHVDSRCSLCNRYRAVFRESSSLDPINGTEMTVKSRRCRCPDRRSCAFVRCQRSSRHHKHEAHTTLDDHWEASPAAAALRRSNGLGLASESSRGQAPTGANLHVAAPPSTQDSFPGDIGTQSPAAALHARVERLLQPTVEPDNIYKWIGSYGRSKTSPVRGFSRRHTSLHSSDESLLSRKSPLPPPHLHARSNRESNSALRPPEKTSAFGRVLRTYPCSCTHSPESKSPPRKESFTNLINAHSCSVDSKIFEENSSERFDFDVPKEQAEQGDGRIAFYSNLERYYRKLYMRAKERAAKMNEF